MKERGLLSVTDEWLQQKKILDSRRANTQPNYWIIHNKIYDLRTFASAHPGGSDWIYLTQGQDITEHFRVHHLNYEKAKFMLDQYYVGECTPHTRYTFEDNGLFQTVRKRLISKYTVEELNSTAISQRRAITLIVVWFMLLIMTGIYKSYACAIVSGAMMLSLLGIAHNFIHKRKNIYRHLFMLLGFTDREWKIMHCISHHIYPNSLLDFQVAGFQPLVYFLRIQPQHWKYAWIPLQILYTFISISNALVKIFAMPILRMKLPNPKYLMVFTQILVLYVCNGQIYHSVLLFITMHGAFGFIFTKTVLCSHRIPQAWTEGAQQIKEYGLYTIATTSETLPKFDGYLSLLLFGGFNIHVIHHFFPTIDHEHLPKAHEILREVCRQRGIKLFQNQVVECNKKMHKLLKGKEPFMIKYS